MVYGYVAIDSYIYNNWDNDYESFDFIVEYKYEI